MRESSSLAILIGTLTFALAACSRGPETPPRQLMTSTFHYPEDLWDAGVEGETILEIHVSALGTVDSAKIETSSGFAGFDSAAINGSRELRFDPARRGNDSIAVKVLLPVQFHLPGGDSTPPAAAPSPSPP